MSRLFVLFAALAVLSPSLAASQTRQVPYGESRGWLTVAEFGPGRFEGCAASINRDGGVWGIGQSDRGAWRLIFEAPGITGQSVVTLDIDRATLGDRVARGDGARVSVPIDGGTLEALRRGNWMSMTVQGGSVGTFSLAGTAAAILKVEECVATQGNAPTPGAVAPAPPPAQGKPGQGGAAAGIGARCPDPSAHASVDAGGAATLYFVNATGRALTVYWIDRSGILDSIAALPAEDGVVIDTTAGHSFLVRDIDGACHGGLIRSGGGAERVDIR